MGKQQQHVAVEAPGAGIYFFEVDRRGPPTMPLIFQGHDEYARYHYRMQEEGLQKKDAPAMPLPSSPPPCTPPAMTCPPAGSGWSQDAGLPTTLLEMATAEAGGQQGKHMPLIWDGQQEFQRYAETHASDLFKKPRRRPSLQVGVSAMDVNWLSGLTVTLQADAHGQWTTVGDV